MSATATKPRKSSHARYTAHRAALQAQGKWQPYAPAEPVRDHIRQVMAATGMNYGQFGAAAGVDGSTVRKILAGTYRQVQSPVAARIMRVTAAAPTPSFGRVNPVGASRRLQALAYAGWPAVELATRLGMNSIPVRKIRDGDRAKIRAATDAKITALYDQLWNTPPPQGTPAEKIAATKTRAHAARQGWLPAGAWDDDTIDDPDGLPAEGWQRQRRLTVAEIAAEARDLKRMGAGLEEITARLGCCERTIRRALALSPEPRAEEAAA